MFKKLITKQKVFSFCLLLFIFALALFFRIYFSYDKVFSDPIKYAADDGVYHMRLVENELLGNHFPYRIRFDPYTYFPYGTYHNIRPLYDQLLAGFIWLISLGKPSLELINKIAPFYPAVLGSLMVFVIYFLAKALWDRKIAFLSAFLMSIAPFFLFRSVLGATDHHVAEVLFSTLSIMFLFFALKSRIRNYESLNQNKFATGQAGIKNDKKIIDIIKKEWLENKKFWLFTVLTGFSLGLYFLTWFGALLFLFIIFVFIVLYYLIEYIFFKNSHNWILLMGIIIFLITIIIISPLFINFSIFRNFYDIQYLGFLVLGILGFVFIGWLGNFIKKRKINLWFFPFYLILSGVLFLFILKITVPFLFEGLISSFQGIQAGFVPNDFARELIGETSPLGIRDAFDTFSYLFYLSLLALIIILYQFIKKRRPEYLLILVWTLIILLITGIIPALGQRRFAYYLACNISFLSAFIAVKGLRFGWQGLKISQRIPLSPAIKPYFTVGSILIIFNAVFFLIFPFPFNLARKYPNNLPFIIKAGLQEAKHGTYVLSNDWYETAKWLKNNTPDPGLDYYAFYQEPEINKETGKISPYSYSESAYGVLARWDIGQVITYYAHRIPIANNFQQGIGRKKDGKIIELGEGVFFLEIDEQKAVKYLDKLRVKYIITDYNSAVPDAGFRLKVKWVQGNLEGFLEEESSKTPSKFDNSMIARLHILDGREETTEREVDNKNIEFYIKPLNYFRLVFESETTSVPISKENKDEIKMIKIFEYVKGAKIKGKTKPDTEVIISTEIETNQERKFNYQKTFQTKESDYFEFIVPYSTFGKKGILTDQTQFEVFASPYKLKIGEKEIEVNISEEDVLEGKTIEVNF